MQSALGRTTRRWNEAYPALANAEGPDAPLGLNGALEGLEVPALEVAQPPVCRAVDADLDRSAPSAPRAQAQRRGTHSPQACSATPACENSRERGRRATVQPRPGPGPG